MNPALAKWCLVLLCLSSATAIGGGLYEALVVNPQWSASPPASFVLIQPDTGVPLQHFWMPVHAALTLLSLAALVLAWRQRQVRRWLLVGLASYWLMRAWSFAYFIPEMLAFQQVPLDSAPTPELLERVASWTRWTVFRQPLDVLSFVSFLLALCGLERGAGVRTQRHAEDGAAPARSVAAAG
jgi:hypothetical protein